MPEDAKLCIGFLPITDAAATKHLASALLMAKQPICLQVTISDI
jgi:hypothetical protein